MEIKLTEDTITPQLEYMFDTSQDWQKLYQVMTPEIIAGTKYAFDTETSPITGQKWAEKEEPNGYGILRGKARKTGNIDTLMKGALNPGNYQINADTLDIIPVGSYEYRVGDVHQSGRPMARGNRNYPVRDFIGISQETNNRIQLALNKLFRLEP